jgi:serine/threonine-protein kinase
MAQEQQTTRCPQCGKSFPATVKLCPDDGTVLEHAPPTTSQVGKVLDGKYRLDAFLSKGGMGAVYRATHVMLNKTVAVKLINPELVTSPDVVRRFQREARAATALSHPNIVSVYDLGQTTEGTLYIAMEFVDGPSLKSVIESGGPVPVMRSLTLARQLASALSAAHRQGIIHRDLKPHNVMLARSHDGQEVAKLVDFGIAKTFDEGTQLTTAGFSPGTPQYMAPEQAEGRAVDARSDLYSFGIILYEMLAGEVPFNATSTAAVLIKQIKEAPMPPSVKNPRVAIPPPVEAIVLRCMAKDPAERFQTADELGSALEESAVALAGSTAAMQATLPMGIPAAVLGASRVATVPAAVVSPSAAAPTVRSQQAPAPQAPADTRTTAAPADGPAPVALASSSRKPGASPVFVIFMLLMAAGAAAIIYLSYFRNPLSQSATTIQPGEPPAASPAMVAQKEPAPPTQSPASPTLASPTPATALTPSPQTPTRTTAENAGTSTTGSSARKAVTAAQQSGGWVLKEVPDQARQQPPGQARQESAGLARQEPAGRTRQEPAGQARQEPAGQAAAAIPESPAVFFQCDGAPDVCGPLRAAVDEAIEKGGLSSVRNAARANITVLTRVEVLQQRVDRQFQTTFAVRNYSIEVSAETTFTNEAVTMPPTTTLSFDPQFGSERAAEKARLVAGDIVDRIKAFVRRKRGA